MGLLLRKYQSTHNKRVPRILRLAARNGIATLVWEKASLECYKLGLRPPVPLGYPYFSSDNSQWWIDESPVEIYAGPMADEQAVKHVEGESRQSAKWQKRAKRKSACHCNRDVWKLEEGLRRKEKIIANMWFR